MVSILERQFPKGECAERGRALVMLAYIEMMLTGTRFKNGEPDIESEKKDDTKPRCNVVEAMCYCPLPDGHKGLHECECGGQWGYESDGEFVTGRFPDPRKAPRMTAEIVKILLAGKRDKNDPRGHITESYPQSPSPDPTSETSA